MLIIQVQNNMLSIHFQIDMQVRYTYFVHLTLYIEYFKGPW